MLLKAIWYSYNCSDLLSYQMFLNKIQVASTVMPQIYQNKMVSGIVNLHILAAIGA